MTVTLYDFLNITQRDFDTYDTEYDTSITVCYIDKEHDNYDKFCNAIIKKANVVKQTDDAILIVDWSKLIKDNLDKFKEFTKNYWGNQYEDDIDEFIYQWINEINLYMAGYVSNDFYELLVRFVDVLE